MRQNSNANNNNQNNNNNDIQRGVERRASRKGAFERKTTLEKKGSLGDEMRSLNRKNTKLEEIDEFGLPIRVVNDSPIASIYFIMVRLQR